MLYNIENVIRRLQEIEKGVVTEEELLAVATPKINSIDHIIAFVRKAVENGHNGQYSIGMVAKYTSISRQTLYRWRDEGIIQQTENGSIDVNELLKALEMIKKRQDVRRFSLS